MDAVYSELTLDIGFCQDSFVFKKTSLGFPAVSYVWVRLPCCLHFPCIWTDSWCLFPISVVTYYLNRGFHPVVIPFICLKCYWNWPLPKLLPISHCSQWTEAPPGAARLVPFLYKKQSVGTVSLWHLKIENLLLLAEVTTGRCHFKNKMLGNEGPQKRLVALAWVCESMFVLADVSQKQVHFYSLHRLDLPLRCQTMLTHIWLIIGFVPKLCMPSSASTHPFAFFLLDIVRFLFTLISAGISSLLLGATEKNKLRSLCDAKFCNVKRIKKIAFFGMCSLAFLNICMCSSGFYYEIWTRRIRNLLGLFSP